jgi:guanylate kinase
VKSFAVAICAPSGAGKTTVCRALLSEAADLLFSVSATSRPPRTGEQDGSDYHFVSREGFESMIESGELLEWAKVHGELYGTPRSNLEEAKRQQRVLVLDIDVQGAGQLVEALPDAVTIFLLPPSFEVLMERLLSRGSEDPGRLKRRLETAKTELASLEAFQYVVINDRLDEAVARIRAIIAGEGQRADRAGTEFVSRLFKSLTPRGATSTSACSWRRATHAS